MNKEDFERLKAVCEKEGFELLKSLPDKDTNFHILAVSKKDIWDGVEFVECINPHLYALSKGKIYKILNGTTIDSHSCFINDNGEKGSAQGHPLGGRGSFKPSTESAYIEQLKKEFEDRGIRKFKIRNTDISMMDGGCLKDPLPEFIYRKDTDTLYFHGVPVYQQGKWATRVKERVEVNNGSEKSGEGDSFSFKFHNLSERPDFWEMQEFVRSQLEKYLNGEVE